MKIVKSAFASAAAASLLVSQAAVAAPVSGIRTGAAIGQGEGLANLPDGSAPVVAIISLLAVVALIAVITDGDDDDSPASP